MMNLEDISTFKEYIIIINKNLTNYLQKRLNPDYIILDDEYNLSKSQIMNGINIVNNILNNESEIISFFKNFENSINEFIISNINKCSINDPKDFFNLMSICNDLLNLHLSKYKTIFHNYNRNVKNPTIMNLRSTNDIIIGCYKNCIIYEHRNKIKLFEILIKSIKNNDDIEIFNNCILFFDNLDKTLLSDNQIIIELLEVINKENIIDYELCYNNLVHNSLNNSFFENLLTKFNSENNIYSIFKTTKNMDSFYDQFLNIFNNKLFIKSLENKDIIDIIIETLCDKNTQCIKIIVNLNEIFNNDNLIIFNIIKLFISSELNKVIAELAKDNIIKSIINLFTFLYNLGEELFINSRLYFSTVYDSFQENFLINRNNINLNILLLEEIKYIFNEIKDFNEFKKYIFSIVNIISFLESKENIINQLCYYFLNKFLEFDDHKKYIPPIEYYNYLISQIKLKLGEQFIKKLELIIHQHQNVKQESDNFVNYLSEKNIPKKLQNLSVYLIHKNDWNLENEYNNIIIPKDLKLIQSIYEIYCQRINNKINKKLNWDYLHSKAEIVFYNDKVNKDITIQCQTIFYIILNYFNDIEILTLSEINVKSGLNNINLIRNAINHLLKIGILIEIQNENETYTVNFNINDDIIIDDFNFNEDTINNNNSYEDYKIIIDHGIVKLLKLNKTMEYSDILDNLREKFKHFSIEKEDFDSSLEGLVKKEYIKYDDNNQYTYIP